MIVLISKLCGIQKLVPSLMDARDTVLCIVVGGAPAPGINGAIAAITIQARKQGYRVIGINNGELLLFHIA